MSSTRKKIGRNYFGHVDASESTTSIGDLAASYYREGSYKDLFVEEDSARPSILVGVKGAGKTALGRILIKEFDGVTWLRDEQTSGKRFTASSDIPRSGTSMHTIKLFLLDQLSGYLLKSGKISETGFQKIKKSVLNIGEKALKATSLKTGILDFDFDAFFAAENSEDVIENIDQILTNLHDAIGEQNILIVLDDVDSYFEGLEDHPRFVEALCRAADGLNRLKEPNIQCLLLLKHGIWRGLYDRPEEYDKIKGSIEFLTWKFDDIVGVLAKRVAKLHGLDQPSTSAQSYKALKKEFLGTNDDIRLAFETIFALSANGPRDAIDLCNKTKQHIQHKRISLEDITSKYVVSRYSEEKLKGVNQDFGHLYPFLPEFAQNLFKSYQAEFSGNELIDHLDTGILNELSKARQSYGDENWCKDATAAGIVKILFDVGIVGIQRNGEPPLFAIEDSTPDQTVLSDSELSVHKAYRPALNL